MDYMSHRGGGGALGAHHRHSVFALPVRYLRARSGRGAAWHSPRGAPPASSPAPPTRRPRTVQPGARRRVHSAAPCVQTIGGVLRPQRAGGGAVGGLPGAGNALPVKRAGPPMTGAHGARQERHHCRPANVVTAVGRGGRVWSAVLAAAGKAEGVGRRLGAGAVGCHCR